MEKVLESYSAEETFAYGKSFGEQLMPGQVCTLIGDLGVGKTVFTQGVAAGLGELGVEEGAPERRKTPRRPWRG